MPTYHTKHIFDFSTRKPFKFEVPQKEIDRIRNFRASFGEENGEDCLFDFLFFPSYKKVREISFGNGYTPELMTTILTDFGTPTEKITELLSNCNFISMVRPKFEDITSDGDRTLRTLMHIYMEAKDLVLTIDVGGPLLRIDSEVSKM